jgi:UDP-glucose 4-epimerase
VEHVARITQVPPIFIEGDVRDPALIDSIFTQYEVGAVIHFAALKAVGESVQDPLKYYDNNLILGEVQLISSLPRYGAQEMVPCV